MAFGLVLTAMLLLFGILGVFGIGAGRPFAIVLLIVAFGIFRRLLMIVFGRRGVGRCGPRRRR
jgi:hypothetical protein